MNTTHSFAGLDREALIVLAAGYARTPASQQEMLSCSRELVARGLFHEAQAVLLRVLHADDTCVLAYELLAGTFESTHAWRRSIAVWEQLLAFDSKNTLALGRLGALHSQLGEWDRAQNEFERAAALSPHDPLPLIGRALAFLALEDLPNLAMVRDKLLAQFAKSGLAHLIDGHLNKIVGQRDRAIAAYRAALSLDPDMTNALFNLTELELPAPESGIAGKLQELRRKAIGSGDRANVCFSLARIFEAAERYREAFTCYQEGNEAAIETMSQLGIAYDPAATLESAERTARNYGRRAAGSANRRLPIDLRLVFIVGLPRSGTSLVEQILASHSEVAGGGELPLAQACMAEFEKRRKDLGITGSVNPADPRDAALLRAMREKYVDGLFERELDAKVVTDKLPGNFSALGFIRLMFPDAVIVHCSREAVALCWSLYTSHFGTHEPYYNSFENLAHYHGVYRRLMDHWRNVLDPPMIEISYEKLATQPEVEIRRLIADCGLAWEPACLEFYTSDRPVFTASQLQVRRPVYLSSIARWKNYQEWLGPLVDMLQTTGTRSEHS